MSVLAHSYIEFIDEYNPYTDAMGMKNADEIAIVDVAAAMSSAIFYATGRHLRRLPMTPDKVLAALQKPAWARG